MFSLSSVLSLSKVFEPKNTPNHVIDHVSLFVLATR